jgi:hypothetical protein
MGPAAPPRRWDRHLEVSVVHKTILTLLLLTTAVWANPFQDHLVQLLRDHGEKNLITDSQGVGLPGQSARLEVKLYDATRGEVGWMVEMEIKIHLPNSEILEFVSGSGETREKATTICLLNFTTTTFHVLYKAFLNPSDTHLDSISFGPKDHPRQLIAGDLIFMGKKPAPKFPPHLESQLISRVKQFQFPVGPHTLKIVYAQETQTMVTLDGKLEPNLAETINQLVWPKSDQPYLMKQFMVVK